jgi:transcriptional regulator of acetoin/glycerol metabolism
MSHRQPTRQSGDDHWTRRTPDRVARGSSAPGAKLTPEQIAALCQEFAANHGAQTRMARKYGVSRVTVWRHLKAAGLIGD